MGMIQVCTITELVKINFKVITLAIGDGANDVGMIQVCTLTELISS